MKHALEQTEPQPDEIARRVAEFEEMGFTERQWKFGCALLPYLQATLLQLVQRLGEAQDMTPDEYQLVGYAAAKRLMNQYEDHSLPAWKNYCELVENYKKKKRRREQ